MKKNIVLILILSGCLIIAQDSSIVNQNSLLINDSLLNISENDSITQKPIPGKEVNKDSIEANKVQKSTSKSVAKPQKTDNIFDSDQILNQLKMPKFNVFKEINFFTFSEILFLVLISIGLTKLIDFISKLKNLKQRFIFFKFAFGTLKGIIWFIVFYASFSLIMPNSNEFVFILILIAFIVSAISFIPLIKNFIGGFYLTVSMPFSVGDYIKINEYEGEVEKINWKDVILNSEGSNIINIPNSLFLSSPVSNFRRQQKEQLVTINFELPFHHEPEKIIKIIYEAALSSPYFYSKMKHKVLLIKNDFIAQKREYQLHIYIIDVKFTDNLIHSLNMIINRAISESK